MKRILEIFLIFIVTTLGSVYAQEEILMTIGGHDITTEEFLRVYNKNNNITPETEKKDVDDYVDLFVNYKLKVIEAINQGYDTNQSFIDEFSGYREQLAKPYLENSELKEGLIEEAYERYKYEVNVSHILVRCPENALPDDTLKAYEKISAIRARVVGGEPFIEVAKATSDDPSIKKNDGNLGYFSVFRMIYPFESAAYNTEVGKISEIIRTSFGYHILKLNDKRPSRGAIKVGHIMTRVMPNASQPEIQAAKDKIDKAYQDLMEGKDWHEAVEEYSENPGTKKKKGEIGWLQSGQAPDEFMDPCYEVEINQFTKPVRTTGGFHIGFVIDKKPIESFEEAQEKITRQIDRDQNRKVALEELQYSTLKNKYNMVLLPENLSGLIQVVDSSLYANSWDAEKAKDLDKPVVKVRDTEYSAYSFAKYLAAEKGNSANQPLNEIVEQKLEEYASKCLTEYAMAVLPDENSDYKYLLNEYHDGILLFNLTNDLVWKKAQEDTVGLEKFYAKANKYQWNDKATVNIYTYTDNSITSKLPELVKKQVKKKQDVDILIKSLCETDSVPCISQEEKVFEKGKDSMADKLNWEVGTYIVESDKDMNYMYYVTKVEGKKDKKLDEARGLYIADYQTHLEDKWINELREKYEIEVKEEVLSKLKKELNK